MISKPSINHIETLFLGHCSPQDNPKLFATCGIPGAGKSTFVDQKLASGEFPQDAFILNPDRVMLALPEYQADEQSIGAQAAYEKWEKPAWDLSYDMAEKARNQRFHFVKDMGCANPLSFDFVKTLKDNGYAMTMYHIHCDLDEAYRRIDKRDFRVSKTSVQSRYESLQTLLPSYRSIADEFHDLNNTNLDMPFKVAA